MINNHQSTIELPADLLAKVMAKIDKEQRLVYVRRRLLFTALFFTAILGLTVPVWQSFQSNINETGFGQYLTLLFSDLNVVVNYWQSFLLSLLESLPIISTIEILSVCLVLLWTLRSLVKYGHELIYLSHNFSLNH